MVICRVEQEVTEETTEAETIREPPEAVATKGSSVETTTGEMVGQSKEEANKEPKPEQTGNLTNECAQHICVSCGAKIPKERIDAVPGVIMCVHCQGGGEESDPDSAKRKQEEGIGGSREDWKKNRRGYYGDGK